MAAQYDEAKLRWGIANALSFAVVIIAIISILRIEWFERLWALAAICTVASDLLQWWADTLRGRAEKLKRGFEFQDGLGWEIPQREIDDFILDASKRVKTKACRAEESPYFDSAEVASPKRVVGNLEQSTWYSQHQAKRMAKIVFVASTISIAVVFTLMVAVLQASPLQHWGPDVGRIAITAFVFMASNQYVRLGFRYYSFSQEADRICDRVLLLRKTGSITDIQASSLLHEYQVAREKAPLIPNFLWKRMEPELNRRWKKRASQQQS